jgi:3',5'-cyclic AMP phosphodiesterase CpdA
VKLYAISDLHVASPENRAALAELPAHPDDWLLVAGDVAESEELVIDALAVLSARFARVVWTPGNHELWTLPGRESARGEHKYLRLVERARRLGVLTPEDEYPDWPGGGGIVVAPLFLLYDYSFRPDSVPEASALEWAMEADLLCTDEILLHPDPHPSRADWCRARVERTLERLEGVDRQKRTVLVNHFPLRRDLVRLERIPRFSIWCGTRATEDWHTRFRALAVVSGHLHVPSSEERDGVRFDEVSLGYPGQWARHAGIAGSLRLILDGDRLGELEA